MIEHHNVVVTIIDVQKSLAQAMHGREALLDNIGRLIAGCRAFEIPILWTEQNPAKLGPTLPGIARAMPEGLAPIPKMSFSCCGEQAFCDALAATGRSEVLLAGIEAHICVYQTAVDLLDRGLRVQVVSDAVSSRAVHNRDTALIRMRDAGAVPTTVEMLLFEMLRTAASPRFKAVAAIVK